MKKFYQHVKNRVLAGVIFLIPLFAIILLIQKLWKTLTTAGSYLVQLFGLKSLLGAQSVTIATAFILILLFYLFGWLVRFKSLHRVRDWMETSVLQYIPGYLTYKAQMQEKINPKEDSRVPVWVATASGKRPGLLVNEQAEEAVVFFPNSPDSNNGEVLLVPIDQVTKLDMKAPAFIKSMQNFGKDLVARALTRVPQHA